MIPRILTAITLLGSITVFSCRPSSPYNVVLIVADDLGWRDVGYNHNPYFETPHIDNLSETAFVFTQAYANAPNCAPTRAALLSGWYAPRTGVYTVASSARGRSEDRKLIPIENKETLDTSFITLPEMFQKAGYTTAHLGKWHLGSGVFGPKGQGFDINIGGNQSGHPASYFSPYRNPDMEDGEVGEYLTDRLSSDAAAFIESHKNNPFFLYVPFYSVHTPIQPREELVAKFKDRVSPLKISSPRYAAMVEAMDQGVGRIMAAVEKAGISERTIMVFMSDNGPYFPVSSADPLRGSKGMLYEGGIRVPLLIRHPDFEGSVIDSHIIGLDLYPTLLELAGVEVGESDGNSFAALISGDTYEEHDLFWHFPVYLGNYAGMDAAWRTTPAGAVRSGDFKLIEFFEDSTLELYNIKEDISEEVDLADSLPETRDRLLRLLEDWRIRTDAPLPRDLNPGYIRKTPE